jgi:hypothetical protein
MKILRKYLVNNQIIQICKICNDYNTINILITQIFPKVYIYIYVRAFKYP